MSELKSNIALEAIDVGALAADHIFDASRAYKIVSNSHKKSSISYARLYMSGMKDIHVTKDIYGTKGWLCWTLSEYHIIQAANYKKMSKMCAKPRKPEYFELSDRCGRLDDQILDLGIRLTKLERAGDADSAAKDYKCKSTIDGYFGPGPCQTLPPPIFEKMCDCAEICLETCGKYGYIIHTPPRPICLDSATVVGKFIIAQYYEKRIDLKPYKNIVKGFIVIKRGDEEVYGYFTVRCITKLVPDSAPATVFANPIIIGAKLPRWDGSEMVKALMSHMGTDIEVACLYGLEMICYANDRGFCVSCATDEDGAIEEAQAPECGAIEEAPDAEPPRTMA